MGFKFEDKTPCENDLFNRSEKDLNTIFQNSQNCVGNDCLSKIIQEARNAVHKFGKEAELCPNYNLKLKPLFVKLDNIVNQQDLQVVSSLISLFNLEIDSNEI